MMASDFDGCQYGLKSVRKGREHLFLRKPWTIASNIPEVFALLCKLCPGETVSHRHDTCNGKNAIASQYYTPFMVTLIHMAIMRHFENRAKQQRQKNFQHAASVNTNICVNINNRTFASRMQCNRSSFGSFLSVHLLLAVRLSFPTCLCYNHTDSPEGQWGPRIG